MRSIRWFVGLLLVGCASGCEPTAYEIKIDGPKEVTLGSSGLYRVHIDTAGVEEKTGTQGDELCLLAGTASGALTCAASTCTTEDSGRRLTMRVALTVPRNVYLLYTLSGNAKRDILGASVYQTTDCSSVAGRVPLTAAVFEFEVKP